MRRGARTAVFISVLATLPSIGVGVSAQPAAKGESAKPAENAEYAQHMTNGVRLFRLDDYAGALVEFEAAYRKEPKASPLINQALAHRKLGRYDRAVRQLELALEKHQDTMSEEDVAAAKRAVGELRALFAFAAVTVEPEGATLLLDGEAVTGDRGAIVLSPGEHEFEAKMPGYVRQTKRVKTASGDRVEVAFALEPEIGRVSVKAAGKNTRILVDGKELGRGSWEGTLRAGKHEIVAEGEGSKSIELAHGGAQTVDFGTAQLPNIPPPPDKPKPPEEPEPTRGFLMRVDGALLFPLRHPEFFDTTQFSDLSRVSSGGYVSGRVGYRVHTFAGFEGMLEYGNVQGPANGTGDKSYSLSSFRVGPVLRLMSPGEVFRFLGTLGGGLAVHLMSYENIEKDTVCPDLEGTESCSSAGADFYAMTEAGFEVDIDGVLLGLSLAAYVSSTKGMNDFQGEQRVEATIKEPYDNRVLPMIGPRIHFGYGFW